jgi:uncharacterized protein YndB with AHSA1/START domain
MNPQFSLYAKMQRPLEEVFDAVYNPQKLSGYFTTGGASGPLDAGSTVTWEFADFPGEYPVTVLRSNRNALLEFSWGSSIEGVSTTVEMVFEDLGNGSVKIDITERGWPDTPEGRSASYGNCMGWMQMLCCLKAYLEHGINLREGMF